MFLGFWVFVFLFVWCFWGLRGFALGFRAPGSGFMFRFRVVLGLRVEGSGPD